MVDRNMTQLSQKRLWHRFKLMDLDKQKYMADSLVYHLSESNQYDRLWLLFANHDWMHLRIETGDQLYDGYLSDIEVAFSSVHAMSNRSNLYLALYIRLMLIRTSITSIVSNFEPALLSTAILTGKWSLERAHSFLRKMENPYQRFCGCIAVLKHCRLTSIDERRIQHLALDSAKALKSFTNIGTVYFESQDKAFCDLAEYLDDDLILEAWRSVQYRNHNGYYRGLLLEAFGPRLNYDTLNEIVSFEIDIVDSAKNDLGHRGDGTFIPRLQQDLSSILVILAPYLTGDALKRGWVAANEIPKIDAFDLPGDWGYSSDFAGRERVLQALQTLSAQSHSPNRVSETAIPVSQVLTSEDFVGKLKLVVGSRRWSVRRDEELHALLRLLNEIYTPEIGVECFELAKSCNSEYDRADILAALAPHIDENFLARFVDQCDQTKSQHARARIVEALAPRLPSNLQRKLLNLALNIIQSRDDREDYRFRALLSMVPHLDREVFNEYLEKTQRISDDSQQISTLHALIPRTGKTVRNKLMDHLLTQARQTENLPSTLVQLAPCLEAEEIPWLLDIATTVPSPDERARIYSALGNNKQLYGIHLEITFTEVMALPVTTNNGSNSWRQHTTYPRAGALFGLAEKLGKREFSRALEEMKLKHKQSQNSLIGMRREKDDMYADFLKRVAPFIAVENVDVLYEEILQVKNRDEKLSLLCVVIPKLSGNLQQKAVDEIIELLKPFFDFHASSDKAKILICISAYIFQLDIQIEALTAAFQIIGEGYHPREDKDELSKLFFFNLEQRIKLAVFVELVEKQLGRTNTINFNRDWDWIVGEFTSRLSSSDMVVIFETRFEKIISCEFDQYKIKHLLFVFLPLIPYFEQAHLYLAIDQILKWLADDSISRHLNVFDKIDAFKSCARFCDETQATELKRLDEMEREQHKFSANVYRPGPTAVDLILAERFRGKFQQTTVESTINIQDEVEFSEVILTSAQFFDEISLKQVVEKIPTISSPESRIRVLCSVLSNLDGKSEDFCQDVGLQNWIESEDITTASERLLAQIEVELTGLFRPPQRKEKLDEFSLSLDWRDSVSRYEFSEQQHEKQMKFLCQIAPFLNDVLSDKVFEARVMVSPNSIEREKLQADLLAALALKISDDRVQDAANKTLSYSSYWVNDHGTVPGKQASTLAALAPRLKGELLMKAAIAAVNLPTSVGMSGTKGENLRSIALKALVPQFQTSTSEIVAKRLIYELLMRYINDDETALSDMLIVAPNDFDLTEQIQVTAFNMLEQFSSEKREQLLNWCAKPNLVNNLPDRLVSEIAGHVYDICTQWKWL